MHKLVLSAICGVWAFTPCRADDFCDGLKKVVAAAPANFEDVRGATDPDGKRYSHPFIITGAVALDDYPPCLIDDFGPPLGLSYACTFPGEPDFARGRHAQSKLAARVGDCLERPRDEPINLLAYYYSVGNVSIIVNFEWTKRGDAMLPQILIFPVSSQRASDR